MQEAEDADLTEKPTKDPCLGKEKKPSKIEASYICSILKSMKSKCALSPEFSVAI